MKNIGLAHDYIFRSEKRLKALQVLFDEESWADVVREAQEIVELCLKAVLRMNNIEVPRIHDVSQILLDEKESLRKEVIPHVDRMAKISHQLRRDRELAYYGSEDLTPSEFYKKADAKEALENAKWLVSVVKKFSP